MNGFSPGITSLITYRGLNSAQQLSDRTCVCEHVAFKLSLRQSRVRTQFASVALLAIVTAHVQFERVAVRERLAALLAGERFLGRVQLLDVNAQVGLATAGGRTQLALEDRFIAKVLRSVRLQTVALSETQFTKLARIRLLTYNKFNTLKRRKKTKLISSGICEH